MVKSFCKKILLGTIVLLSIFLCGSSPHIHTNLNAENYNNIEKEYIEEFKTKSQTLGASRYLVQITSTNLRDTLARILGKGNNTNFYSDDFLKHPRFKPVTTTDPETGVSTTTAETYQLDLSGSGVVDITELCQFEFPTTLRGINLASNGINNNHLASISNFLTYEQNQKVTFGQTTITSRMNVADFVKMINLNDNKIDLHTTSAGYLENTKLFFGIQLLSDLDSSGLLREGEINPCYYIRDNTDLTVFSFEHKYEFCTNENMLVKNIYGEVIDIVQDGEVDKHWLDVHSVPESPTAYFKEYTWSKEFIVFNLEIDSNFKVERLSFLNLKVDANGKIQNDSPIKLSGFGDNSNVKLSYNQASTNKITEDPSKPDAYKNIVNITIEFGGIKRIVPTEFIVIDTIKPVIKINGSHHVYASRNRDYKDLGAIAYDPAVINGERIDGEDLIVNVTSNVQVTVLGLYTVTYTARDYAGNIATDTRTVEVIEKALDRVYLRTDTKQSDSVVGEDIVLIAYLDQDLPLDKFSDIRYEWYVDGVKFITTKADTQGTGLTTYTPLTAKKHTFSVKVIATQKSDGERIEVECENALIVDITKGATENDKVILAVGLAVLLIIIVIAIATFLKYKKSSSKTHKKHKNFHKGKSGKNVTTNNKPDQPEIQVIKNYSGNNNGGNADNGTGGTGGGNSNFRLPENGDQGRDK